ncbi:hypothetical protein LRP30_30820 [Bradyrhizobium sp. C-145]|uniref:hypothetical protein n=1 Tax=Bradyrhizobium sp. C-145 TaxID=574727 RepID=UPI00201B770B|nr:hypothetical protein [Bradyrhizobium sp. C-145]UQR61314.1 hypothetical protein LRP30_30820 [Bradyrhizobium sp. C-145]
MELLVAARREGAIEHTAGSVDGLHWQRQGKKICKVLLNGLKKLRHRRRRRELLLASGAIIEIARKLERCVAQEAAFHTSRDSRSGSSPRLIIVDAGGSWSA